MKSPTSLNNPTLTLQLDLDDIMLINDAFISHLKTDLEEEEEDDTRGMLSLMQKMAEVMTDYIIEDTIQAEFVKKFGEL